MLYPTPAQAQTAANFISALANPNRLLILCELLENERSVSELIQATGIAQTSMSQHLGKLRTEGLVDYRRDHRTLYYRIQHPVVTDIMAILHHTFCSTKNNQ